MEIFPRCWPFVRGGDRWIPLTQASDTDIWCFLWSVPEQTVEQIIETPVIWDASALILTSHHNDTFKINWLHTSQHRVKLDSAHSCQICYLSIHLLYLVTCYAGKICYIPYHYVDLNWFHAGKRWFFSYHYFYLDRRHADQWCVISIL